MAAIPEPAPDWPDVDPDLTSASCMGIGLQFPHLWEVVKRYILRGDNYFQNGGLTTLAANIWSMPLDEATDVLEQYYEQHHYFPPAAGQRGGVNLAGLQAIHAVATAPDFGITGNAASRKERLVEVLEKHQRRIRETLGPLVGADGKVHDSMAGDRAAVDETLAAIRADQPWEVKVDFTAGRVTPGAAESTSSVPAVPGTTPAYVTHEEVEASIARAAETLRADVAALAVSPAEMIKAKYGYDQLDQRIGYMEESFRDKVEGLERNIDRFMGREETQVGKSQVRIGKWGIGLAAATLLLGLLAPRAAEWLRTLGVPI